MANSAARIASFQLGNKPEQARQKRDLLSIMQLSSADVLEIVDRGFALKRAWERREATPILNGCTLAMIFEKASLRTRSTFEIGIRQLGGHSIDLSNLNIGMGTRESVADIARNLDRWCDLIMIRTFGQERAEVVARETFVPVINALTDEEHPCQVLGDIMTLMELEGTRELRGFPLAYLGDGFNVCQSLICLGALLGMDMRVGCPDTYEPKPEYIRWAQGEARRTGGRLLITSDPAEAVAGARAVYTDIWASMGLEHEHKERVRIFTPYQVNADLMAQAAEGAYVMHDLPARRGEEITNDQMDGPHSIVYLQAEFRLHVQKGIMAWLAEKAGVTGFSMR